jgi:hypothetical protein
VQGIFAECRRQADAALHGILLPLLARMHSQRTTCGGRRCNVHWTRRFDDPGFQPH